MLFQDRQRGTLFGLAVGDALGAAVEFKMPSTFLEVTGYRGGGPHGLAPGEWTDDTSMALALADSIANAGWDLNDQGRRYLAWWQHGEYSVNGRCFDIGITTRSALSRFSKTGDARTSGDHSERASGNGSIMRLAPVPIRYADLFPDQVEELFVPLVESSLPTHASPQCLSACVYLGLVLAGLIHGMPREEVLAPDWEPLQRVESMQALHPKVQEVAAGSFREKQPPHIAGTGYVVKSLEAGFGFTARAPSRPGMVKRASSPGRWARRVFTSSDGDARIRSRPARMGPDGDSGEPKPDVRSTPNSFSGKWPQSGSTTAAPTASGTRPRGPLELDGQLQVAFERTTLSEQPDYRRADGFCLCSKEDGDDGVGFPATPSG